jgi:hypothetical protein
MNITAPSLFRLRDYTKIICVIETKAFLFVSGYWENLPVAAHFNKSEQTESIPGNWNATSIIIG